MAERLTGITEQLVRVTCSCGESTFVQYHPSIRRYLAVKQSWKFRALEDAHDGHIGWYCGQDMGIINKAEEQMSTMTRAEHLAWAKKRAIECLPSVQEAFASMVSDLNKHDELRKQHETTNLLGVAQLASGDLNSPAAMRKWIEGYS